MKHYKKVFLCTGILMLTSELWKQWCLTYPLGSGHYNWWYFPFQLCSIPMYVCLAIPFVHTWKITSVLLTFLMDYGLLAGAATFLDTSGLHYPYLPLTVHSYLWHILMIILGFYAGYIEKNVPKHIPAPEHSLNRNDFAKNSFAAATGLYLACCLTATFCNITFHSFGSINMFYISPYYRMTQKVFRHIAEAAGNTAGITTYIAATILGAGLIHQLWHNPRWKCRN